MIRKLSILSAICLATLTTKPVQAKNPLTVNLNEDGSRYIKFGANLQLWGRYSELNPGSMVGSNITDHSYDFVIRRLRLQAMGMLTEKVFFHFQMGQNNINFTQNTNPANTPLSVLDALGEYHFNDGLHIGAGICGYGAGTTRYSAQSSSSQLGVDAPIYQQNNITSTFGNRNLSIYAKGRIGSFSYRAVVTNPYKAAATTLGTAATIATRTPNPNLIGTLTYSFFDKESIVEPYNKATYLGTKKILNVSAGIMYQSKAMWRKPTTSATDTLYQDMKVIGIDVFYEAPINTKGAAITAYAAYNHCDYGNNYLRSIATPNPASIGTGTGFYGIGTGDIFYAQFGYLLNKHSLRAKTTRTQLYATAEVAALQALKTPMIVYEAGINYYITGTLGPKITLGYQNRDIFSTKVGEAKQVETARKGMLVLQYQVSF